MTNNHYAFTLGREWKLSLAELFSIFGEKSYVCHNEQVTIFQLLDKEKDIIANFRNIGGSIRVMKVLQETETKKFATDVIEHIGKPEGKFHFALGVYGEDFEQNHVGLRIKKTLGEKGISARLINTENKNINAAGWKKERLGKSQSEYNLLKMGEKSYLTVTLACQDVDAYAKRDTEKSRDMVVGMMPPKLCQMMINIAGDTGRDGLYDPFCGLGTFLIEGANMGKHILYGSDISPRMVHSSKKSLADFIEEEKIWQERIIKAGGVPTKDFRNLQTSIFEQDAARINLVKDSSWVSQAVIASEGYLGEIMSSKDINLERVRLERKKLSELYDGFFSGLKKLKFSGNIVMSFPFWNIEDRFVYFSEIYEILEKYGFRTIPLLPSHMKLNTMKGSLLYRRSLQTVGREIIKIRL
ncbi:MAG: TRM11 family methyltransferase [Candidatus Altimarinota bacterium]